MYLCIFGGDNEDASFIFTSILKIEMGSIELGYCVRSIRIMRAIHQLASWWRLHIRDWIYFEIYLSRLHHGRSMKYFHCSVSDIWLCFIIDRIIECCQLTTIKETSKKTVPSIKSPVTNVLPKTFELTAKTPTTLNCLLGRDSCNAVFHGTPWIFKSESQSAFPSKLVSNNKSRKIISYNIFIISYIIINIIMMMIITIIIINMIFLI